MKIRRIQRKYIGLSWMVYILSMILMLSVLFPIQQSVKGNMKKIHAKLMYQLEEEFQVNILYDSISPSIFQYIELRNIELINKEDNRTILSVDRFRVHYSLLELLFSKQTKKPTTLSIHRANIYIDAVNQPYILQKFLTQGESQDQASITQEKPKKGTTSLPDFAIKATQCFITIYGENQSITIESQSIDATFKDNNIDFKMLGLVQGYQDGEHILSSDLRITGQTGNFFQTFVTTVKLKQLKYANILITDQSFQIHRDQNVLNLSKVEGKTPLDISLRYYLTEQLLEADFEMEALEISEIFQLEGTILPQTLVTGKGSVTYSVPRKNIFYSGDLDVLLNNILFSGQIYGNNGIVTAKQLKISKGSLSGTYSGIIDLTSIALEGLLTLEDQDSGTTVLMESVVTEDSTEFTMTLQTEGITVPEISGAVVLDLEQKSADIDIEILSHKYLITTRIEDSLLRVTGREGTLLRGEILLDKNNPFTFASKSLPIPVNNNGTESGFLSIQLSGNITEDGVPAIELEDLKLQAFDMSILAEANFDGGVLSIHTLGLDYGDLRLRGLGNISIIPGETLEIDANMDFSFLESFKDEVYSLVAQGSPEEITGTINMPVIPVNRLFPKTPGRGHFVGLGTLSGPLTDPKISLEISSKNAQIRQSQVFGTVRVFANLQNIQVETKRLIYGSLDIRNFMVNGDIENGTIQGKTDITSPFMSDPLTSTITLNLMSRGTNISEFLTSSFQGDIHFSDLFVGEERFPNIDLFAYGHNGRLNLVGGPSSGMLISISSKGDFSAHLSQDLPLMGTFSGFIRSDEILISSNNISIDMSILNYLNIEDLKFHGGRAYGSLTVSGAPGNPDWNGYLATNSHTATIGYIPEPLTLPNVLFTAEGKDIELHPFTVQSGKQQATIAGSLNLEDLKLRELNLSIDVDKKTGLDFDYDFDTLGLGIDGTVFGNFNIYLGESMIELSGNLKTQKTAVTIVERRKSDEGSSKTILNIDLEIETGRDVKFLWPDESFPILLAVATPGNILKIHVDGRSQRSLISGDIKIRGGEIYYLQRSFYITNGSIVFNEADGRFDPVVQIEAKLRDVDSSGERVDIYLSIPESPLSKFSPTFTSSPYMSDQEIIGVLAGNFIPTNIDGDRNFISAVSSVADFGIRQIDQVNNAVKRVREALNLDILTVRTQFIQNVVLYQYSYFFGQQEQAAPLITLFDNTTITFGKTIFSNLYVQALFRLTTDPPSFTKANQNDIVFFESEFGLEWDTPFFLFSLSIRPELNDPMSLLRNTYLGFSWRYIL